MPYFKYNVISSKFAKMPLFRTIFIIFLLAVLSYSAWVAKIDNKEISAKEFQGYIDFHKDTRGENGDIRTLFGQGVDVDEAMNQLLQDYIDRKIILHVADKSGYNRKNDEINKLYNEQKPEWLQRYFLLKEIGKKTPNVDITEADLKAAFLKINQNPGVTYDQLGEQEKQALYQQVVWQKLQVVKKDYQKILEKNYKVTRNKMSDYYVAIVGSYKIKGETLNKELDNQLKLYGLNKSMLDKEKPTELKQMKKELLEELILQELVKKEMAKQKFEGKGYVKTALGFFYDQIILEYFIQKEITDKIEVSLDEIGEAYNANKAEYEKHDFTKVQKYLEGMIRESKQEQKLRSFIAEKKEESVIKRNKPELKNIK